MLVRLALRVAVYRKGLPKAIREYLEWTWQQWRELKHSDDTGPDFNDLGYHFPKHRLA